MQESTQKAKEEETNKEIELVPEIKGETLITSSVEVVQEEGVNNAVPVYELGNPKTITDVNTLSSLPSNFEDVENAVRALESMTRLAQTLIKSSLCPLPKVEDVILAIITGNQYGLPFMTSINQIVPIKGKPTLSAHLHRALLLKHGIGIKKIYDYQPMFDWAQIKEDNSGYVMVEVKLANGQAKQVPKIIKRSTIEEKPTEKCVASAEVDRITRYEFWRTIRLADGTYSKITTVSEYKISDAIRADLMEKDNYVKHTPRMLDARAFTTGAREIAADITLGIYTLNELADAYNIPYTISASLEEEIVRK